MIDGKTIADLRVRLLTMRVAESKVQGASTRKRDLFVESLFPATPDRLFYEVFSPVVGELLAMADGFQKLRRVRESCQELQQAQRDAGKDFDFHRAFDILCATIEQVFRQFEELETAAAEANVALANEGATSATSPKGRQS